MYRRLPSLIASILVLLCGAVSASAGSMSHLDIFDGFGRGVILYGDYTVDLGYGLEFGGVSLAAPPRPPVSLRGNAPAVEICNTDAFFCLRSKGEVSFVAPRACGAPAVGTVWSVGDVKTVVLAHYVAPWFKTWSQDQPPPEGAGPPDVYLLGDPARPQSIYFYSPRHGVTDVMFRDGGPGERAVELARAGKIDPFAAAKPGGPIRKSLLTPDTVAACK